MITIFTPSFAGEADANALRDFPTGLHTMIDPAPAWQLFNDHQAGADRSDQLFRWLVLSRRCREAEPA